jgi:hypothetical protein
MTINLKVLCGVFSKSIFWVRVFGVGISGKNTVIHPLLFSQRNGYEKYLRIGEWVFFYLPRSKMKQRAGQ